MFARFDGMFAIALIDLEKNNAILARDRVGLNLFFITRITMYLFGLQKLNLFLKINI